LAGRAQPDRPGAHASGGPSGGRHNLRDWPIRRNPVGRVLPIMWNHGTGAEVMQRIAVPMIGGMVSATVLTLVVIPSIYAVVKGFGLPAALGDGDAGSRHEHTVQSRPLEVHEGAK